MKQSLGAAYSGMRKAGHKMSDEGMCEACDGKCKYAGGGEVKGVHETYFDDPETKADLGESRAGMHAKTMQTGKSKSVWENKPHKEKAIEEHHKVLGELKAMPKPKLKGLAHGGEVKGFDMNASQTKSFMDKGEFTSEAKGGEVDADGDHDDGMDHELMDQCCDELLKALETKNKKEILDSLKAIILSIGE